MAKKKGGTSIGLILTLIFFILATFVTGTIAYFGYADQQQLKDEKEKAEKDKKLMEGRYREERVRKILLRMAIGIEAPVGSEGEADSDSDRMILVSESDAFRPQIKEEYDRLMRVLDSKLPDKGAFKWMLTLSDAQKQDPAAALKTLPQIIQDYKDETAKARDATKQANEKTRVAEDRAAAAALDLTKEKDMFLKALADLKAEVAKFRQTLEANYAKLVADHKGDGEKAAKEVKRLGDENNVKADDITTLQGKIKDQADRIRKQDESIARESKQGAIGVDFVNLEERKGEIVRRDDNGFVTVNIGSAKGLKPQITFLVVSSDVSWLAMLEKEASLTRNAPRERLPFEDNPYVKGGIEIIGVTGLETARAKIVFENEPIRNPIQRRDQIFNLAWTPNEEIRIAFGGIIDLDGDGLDNNEDFLRMLERQGVVVDEYLKLKPLEFVKRDGKGMSLSTKFLVIAPSPRLDSIATDKGTQQSQQIQLTIQKMSELRGRAKELGVQIIEAHKFLAMIGYKLPKNPVPPAYGAAVYIDVGANPAVPAEPKKDGN